jgi:hypothetical protein
VSKADVNSVRLAPIVLVVGAGLVLGIPLGELAGYLPEPWYLLTQTWTPWVVASFFVAYLFRSAAASIVAGISVIAIGLLSYVAYKAIAYGAFSIRPLGAEVPYLIVFGLGVGAIAGGGAALARDERPWLRAVGWGVPAAAAVAETVSIITGVRDYGVLIALVVGIVAVLVLIAGWLNASPLRLVATTTLMSLCALAVVVVDRSPLY